MFQTWYEYEKRGLVETIHTQRPPVSRQSVYTTQVSLNNLCCIHRSREMNALFCPLFSWVFKFVKNQFNTQSRGELLRTPRLIDLHDSMSGQRGRNYHTVCVWVCGTDFDVTQTHKNRLGRTERKGFTWKVGKRKTERKKLRTGFLVYLVPASQMRGFAASLNFMPLQN